MVSSRQSYPPTRRDVNIPGVLFPKSLAWLSYRWFELRADVGQEFTGSANTARERCDTRRKEEWRFVIGLKLLADETIVSFFARAGVTRERNSGCFVQSVPAYTCTCVCVCVCVRRQKEWMYEKRGYKACLLLPPGISLADVRGPRERKREREREREPWTAAIRRFNFRPEVRGNDGLLRSSPLLRRGTNIPAVFGNFLKPGTVGRGKRRR